MEDTLEPERLSSNTGTALPQEEKEEKEERKDREHVQTKHRCEQHRQVKFYGVIFVQLFQNSGTNITP